MTKSWLLVAATLIPTFGGGADEFVRPLAPIVALAHVRVIDGSGRTGRNDQTVVNSLKTMHPRSK